MNDSFQISMQITPDENGYYDRECPNEDCLFLFKVNLEDWENNIAGHEMCCPRCGLKAPHDEWFTQDQIEIIEENAISFTEGLIHDALATEFKRIEQRSRLNKFVKVSYEPGRRPQYVDLPITQSEEWSTEIVCDKCGMRFSVIGNAYFCPACGKDLTTTAIYDALASYKRRIDGLDQLYELFEKVYSPDEARKQIDLLREDTLGSLIGTLESFLKARYEELGGISPKPNTFQRVEDGSDLFKKVIGESYEEIIGYEKVRILTVLTNRRHLLIHNNGIVDDLYIRKSGDNSYEVGQRIIVKNSDLSSLLDIMEQLVKALNSF